MASTTWLADYSIFVIPKQCGKEQQATFFLSNWKTISWNLNDSLTNTILEWFNGIFVKTNDLSQTTLWKNAKFTLTEKKISSNELFSNFVSKNYFHDSFAK